MKRINAKRERGAALLALLAIIMLGASWFLLSQLNAESGGMSAVIRARNAAVLNKAKQALIGYVAMQAANSGEDNPGALPCPEAAGYFDNPSQEGQTASSCTLPKVGRFPWRTIGTEKLVDSAGEPLWYVVSPGWALTSGNTNINSNTLGQLTVDGRANDAVALIIAPGPAFSVPACASIVAWNQVRPTTGTPDWRNYLECDNANSPPDASFVTTGPSGSFNDQVVRVTVADIMPGIEAAVARRIERDIVPALKTVYATTQWGAGISATKPLFPYPAPFGNPGTSNFQGTTVTVAGAPQGLLPFNQTQGCNPATDVRCTTTLTAWASPSPAPPPDVTQTGGFGYFQTKTCSWQSGGNVAFCQGEYHRDDSNIWGSGMIISMTATINNVAMGLRVLDTAKATIEAEDDVLVGTLTTITPTISATMNSNGSVTIAFSGTLPNIDVKGWGTYANYRIRLERAVIGDHALLSSAASTTGWFVRNEWYRLLYYATSQQHTAVQLPFTTCPITGCCTTGTNCLTVTNMTPSDNKRSLLILAGRTLTNAARPNGTLSDFMEFANADLNTVFEKQPIRNGSDAAAKKPFNDRVIVLDSN